VLIGELPLVVAQDGTMHTGEATYDFLTSIDSNPDSHLSAADKSKLLACQALIEDKIRPAWLFTVYCESENFNVVTRQLCAARSTSFLDGLDWTTSLATNRRRVAMEWLLHHQRGLFSEPIDGVEVRTLIWLFFAHIGDVGDTV
jgi:hypothetical protein